VPVRREEDETVERLFNFVTLFSTEIASTNLDFLVSFISHLLETVKAKQKDIRIRSSQLISSILSSLERTDQVIKFR
jgi:hypothetical protein